jgi:hypothetical protein
MDNDFTFIHVVFHVILFIVVHGLRAQRGPNARSQSNKPPRL